MPITHSTSKHALNLVSTVYCLSYISMQSASQEGKEEEKEEDPPSISRAEVQELIFRAVSLRMEVESIRTKAFVLKAESAVIINNARVER